MGNPHPRPTARGSLSAVLRAGRRPRRIGSPTPGSSALALVVKSRRLTLGLSQAQLARAMRCRGFGWFVGPTVSQIELGTRRITIDELALLTKLLRFRVQIGTSGPSSLVTVCDEEPRTLDDYEERTLRRSIARALDVPDGRVETAATALWTHGLVAEREGRLGRLGRPGAVRVSRGHVTRQLKRELRAWLVATANGPDGEPANR